MDSVEVVKGVGGDEGVAVGDSSESSLCVGA